MKLKRFLKKNNRGSGIVTVLVGVVFLASFGSMLLMLSYTGFEMRDSDRKGKESLYDASAIMEQMRAGVQQMCSDSIIESYSDTLPKYSEIGNSVTREFQIKFRDHIRTWTGAYVREGEVKEPGASGYVKDLGYLIRFDGTRYLYSIDVLEAMIVDKLGGEVTVSSENLATAGSDLRLGYVDNFTDEIVDGETPAPIILRDVSVTFSTSERTSRVVADITMNYPSLGGYSGNVNDENGIKNYACIVKGTLKQGGQEDKIIVDPDSQERDRSVINGGAYFGSAELTGYDSTLTFKNGTFVTPGKIDLKGYRTISQKNHRFIAKDDSILWANDIEVNTDGAVSLLGDTRIANDLNVKGKEAYINLGGSYFGFGYSDTDSSDSSSILVNYRGTGTSQAAKFDFGSLNSLILAGRSFIGSGNNIYTGESISARENQKVYLLPAEMVYYIYQNGKTQLQTNPEKMETAKFQAIQNHGDEYPADGFYIDENVYVLGKKKAVDYGITGVKMDSEYFAGNSMVYAFAEFETEANANEFFKDYYAANPDKINNYLKRSVNTNTDSLIPGNPFIASRAYNTLGGVQEAGYTDETEMISYIGLAETYKEQYVIQKTTLGLGEPEEGEEGNPLDIILSADIHDLAGGQPYKTYTDLSGVIVAIAANGTVDICRDSSSNRKVVKINGSAVENANPDNVCLILATGDITIDGKNYAPNNSSTNYEDKNDYLEFNGLIITEGNLTLKKQVHLNEDPVNVTQAYAALASDGSNITDYIEVEEHENDKNGTAWTVTELVTYNNWRRYSDDDDE